MSTLLDFVWQGSPSYADCSLVISLSFSLAFLNITKDTSRFVLLGFRTNMLHAQCCEIVKNINIHGCSQKVIVDLTLNVPFISSYYLMNLK